MLADACNDCDAKVATVADTLREGLHAKKERLGIRGAEVRAGSRVAAPFVAQRLADIRGQSFKSVQCHENGAATFVAEFAETLQELAFFFDRLVSFVGQDVQHVETASVQTGHAENAGVDFAGFNANIAFERHTDELGDLLIGIAETLSL